MIVFSRTETPIEDSRYQTKLAVVRKPDIAALEAAVEGLALSYPEVDRRRWPTRRIVTAGPSDASAFYAAVAEAVEGDAFVSVSPTVEPTQVWVGRLTMALRETDLVLKSSSALLLFMPASGEEGVVALHERLTSDASASNDGVMQAVVLDAGESAADAFARLKDATLELAHTRRVRVPLSRTG